MRRDVEATRRLMAVVDPNPVPVRRPGRALDHEGWAALERILATPRGRASRPARHTRSSRRASLAAVGAVAVAVGALAIGALMLEAPVGSEAYAATPRPLAYDASQSPPAREFLFALATAAERNRPVRDGRYDYVKRAGWYLNTEITSDSVYSEVVATEIESWVTADGSGRIIESRDASREARRLRSGDVPLRAVSRFSLRPDVLAGQLLNERAEGNNRAIPDGVERMLAIEELLKWQVAPPKLQAALWRVLAETEGLVTQGAVTDRAGRHGIAIGIESAHSGLPTRYTMIFDPHTGRLLSEEETLTRDAGQLNVPIPAVTSYTTYLGAGSVNAISARH